MTKTSHRYLKEIEMREEAGTPAIVGAIRTGLVFQLKQVHGDHMEALKTISCDNINFQMRPETTVKAVEAYRPGSNAVLDMSQT